MARRASASSADSVSLLALTADAASAKLPCCACAIASAPGVCEEAWAVGAVGERWAARRRRTGLRGIGTRQMQEERKDGRPWCRADGTWKVSIVEVFLTFAWRVRRA
jgi:hypothetical protein